MKGIVICPTDSSTEVQQALNGITVVTNNKVRELVAMEAAELFPRRILFVDVPNGMCNLYEAEINALLSAAMIIPEYFVVERKNGCAEKLNESIVPVGEPVDFLSVEYRKMTA